VTVSATVIEELVIRLGFQPSPSARNALRDFEVGLQGLVTAATAAVAALGALTIQQAYAGDEAAKTARALGVTVEEYSRIAAAAAGSGVQIEDLRTGMASLTRQLDAAGQAGSPLAATFAQLGIEVRDSSGNLRSAADVLPELADALNRTDLGGRNGAIGLQLLGDGATKMATMLAGGSKGMREAAERAEALGLVIGQDFADDSEDLVASLREVSAVVSGVARVITGPLIGALDRVIERVLDWYARNRDVISTQIDRFAVVLAAALDGLTTPLGQVVGLFVALGAAFVQYQIAGSMLSAAKAIPVLGAALESLSASFAVLAAWAWPITAVVAALTALYLIGDDLVSAFSGGESAIAGFFEYLQPGGAEAFRAVLHGVVDVLGALGDLAVAVGERIGLYLSGALEELGIVFEALWTIGGLFFDLLGSAASIVYDVGTAIASTLLGALRELVPGLDLALAGISAVYGFLADLFAPQIEYVGQVLEDYLIGPLNTAAEVLGELLSLDLGALASRLASLAGWFGGAAESVSAGTATESTAQAGKIGAARVGLGAVRAGAVVASQAAAAGARTVSSTVNGGPVSVTMNVTGATPEEVEAIARRTVAGAVSDGYATVGGGVR
jgi:hypothetical protein